MTWCLAEPKIRAQMANPSQLLGQTLGHYRILELIGAGGMGVVYRALDTRLNRNVAVKVLPPGALHSEKARRRFRREALALAKLNHPNIATIHDFNTEGGTDFLVMEYVAGLSLADKLAMGRMTERQVFAIAEQVSKALQCAHGSGLVHRDLKPGNIMITTGGDAKLLDFGLSVLLKAADETLQSETVTAVVNRVTGTLLYMAPEQLRGLSLDGRCDIYAAGAVMYEMATGHPPFESKVSAKLIDDILHAPVALPQSCNPKISVGLSEIILKCLEKEADDRYQSAKELLSDLRRLVTASKPVVVVTGQTQAVRRRLRENRALLIVVTVTIAALLAAYAAGRWRSEEKKVVGVIPALPTATAPLRSIAVLPLDNLSGDVTQDYFADGMTEELIGALSKISMMRVISRTSVMQYKGVHKKPLPQIAKELGVDTVLEGSVARNEKTHRVRISAQLIDAATDRSVWSESYERDAGDVFAMQGEVARNVAREIRAQLTPEEQERLASSRPVNAAAHEAYLKGRYHWQRGTEQQFREAKTYFEQAIAIDPKYAAAYAGLADYYSETDDLAPQVAMPKAKELVLRALTIDETLADAHTTLGSIKFYGDWDWSAAEMEFKRAVALNPSNTEAHRMYSVYLSQMGLHDAAEEQIQPALKLDPISFSTSVTAGWAYNYRRMYDRAIEQCERSLKLDPDAVSGHECLSAAYLGKGAYQRAIAEARVMSTRTSGDPVRLAAVGRAYAMAGEKGEAETILSKLYSASQAHYVPPYFFAIVYAALGDREQSIHWLERAYSAHDTYLVRLKVDDAMDPLRSDPRFEKLLLRMGLSP